MTVASAPYSWMPMGRSASSKRMSWNRCSSPRATPTAEMNSDTTTSAPKRRHSNRNGDSDTPAMGARKSGHSDPRSEEHTSELQSLAYLVCRLLLEKKKKKRTTDETPVRQIGSLHHGP